MARRPLRSRLTYANVMSTLALFVALSGGAMAATSLGSSRGKVNFCVTRSGAVRVLVGSLKKGCGKGVKLVTVNQQGVAGAVGPAGPAGPAGPPGAAGTPGTGSGLSYSAGSGLALTGSTFSADFTKVQARIAACTAGSVLESASQTGEASCFALHAYSASADAGYSDAAVSLPAGSWVLFGQISAAGANVPSNITCTLMVGSTGVAHASQGLPQESSSPDDSDAAVFVVAPVTTTAPQGTSVQNLCTDDEDASVEWGQGEIVAIPVGALN